MGEVLRDLFCSVVGGINVTYVGLPFDTIKTRMQTSGSDVFSSPWASARKTVADEGITALWKGAIPALSSALTEAMVVMTFNGIFRRAFVSATRGSDVDNGTADAAQPLGFWSEAAIGGCSGIVSSIAVCPAEVMKVRLQADRGRGGTAAGRLGLASCAANVWKEEGARGFFRGLPVMWARDVPYFVVFFAVTSTYLDTALKFHGLEKKEDLSMAHYFVSGSLGGMIGWGSIYPLDVVKSRIQLGMVPRGTPFWEAGLHILRTEGISALRGLVPCVARAFPANGAFLLGVETAQSIWRKSRLDEDGY